MAYIKNVYTCQLYEGTNRKKAQTELWPKSKVIAQVSLCIETILVAR